MLTDSERIKELQKRIIVLEKQNKQFVKLFKQQDDRIASLAAETSKALDPHYWAGSYD